MGLKDALKRLYRDFDRGQLVYIGYTAYVKVDDAKAHFPAAKDGKTPALHGYATLEIIEELVKSGIIRKDTPFFFAISEGAILE